MNDPNIRNFVLNMISTRFYYRNEIFSSLRKIHDHLFSNIQNLFKNFFIIELKNVLILEKIEYHYEAKAMLKLFL